MSKLPVAKSKRLPAVPSFDLALPDKPAPLDIDSFDDLSQRVAQAQKLLRYRKELIHIQDNIDKFSKSHPDYSEINYCLMKLDVHMDRALQKQSDQLRLLIRTALVQIVAIQLASVDDDLRALNVGL